MPLESFFKLKLVSSLKSVSTGNSTIIGDTSGNTESGLEKAFLVLDFSKGNTAKIININLTKVFFVTANSCTFSVVSF